MMSKFEQTKWIIRWHWPALRWGISLSLAGGALLALMSLMHPSMPDKTPIASTRLGLIRLESPSALSSTIPPKATPEKATPEKLPRKQAPPQVTEPLKGHTPMDRASAKKMKRRESEPPPPTQPRRESPEEGRASRRGSIASGALASRALVSGASSVLLVSAMELDPGFRLLRGITPDYPQMAYRLRRKGEVRLQLEINEKGGVDSVRVLKASEGFGFRMAAQSAYRIARFSPPTMNGKPVRVLWRITVQFTP